MLKHYFKYCRVITRFRSGALGNEMDNIATDLSTSGYKRASIKLYLARIAHFGMFAVDHGCDKLHPIQQKVIDSYLEARPTIASRSAAKSALGHARRCCSDRFVPMPTQGEADPDDRLLTAYSEHLQVIRGLQAKTCSGRVLAARRMLSWHKEHLAGKPLSALAAKHILSMTRDLLANCGCDRTRSSTTTHMRSFLRYLFWVSLNEQELAQFVPRTPCWSNARLPPRLSWENVRCAIDSIELTTQSGIRDRAIMLVLATTGIRNKELRQLELDDIHWRTGELVLRHTKGCRDRIVPLLDEPSSALAEYVLHARPDSADRRVFLSLVPPIRALNNSGTVSRVVRARLLRSGITVPRGGAHLLRHSLATRLVEARRPIKEVADLLGHQNIDTTSIYVKIAVTQLSELPLPFPGGES